MGAGVGVVQGAACRLVRHCEVQSGVQGASKHTDDTVVVVVVAVDKVQ